MKSRIDEMIKKKELKPQKFSIQFSKESLLPI